MEMSETYYGMVSMSRVDEDMSKFEYQTEEVQEHDRWNDPSVKFAKECLLFFRVDIGGILDSTVLFLIRSRWRVGSGVFHLQIHREWIDLNTERQK